jgi:hypothetical protein
MFLFNSLPGVEALDKYTGMSMELQSRRVQELSGNLTEKTRIIYLNNLRIDFEL